jgi:hypothetical protein
MENVKDYKKIFIKNLHKVLNFMNIGEDKKARKLINKLSIYEHWFQNENNKFDEKGKEITKLIQQIISCGNDIQNKEIQ